MKKIVVSISLILCSLLVSVTAYAARGVVAYYDSSSSKIVIKTSYNQFTCGTVYGGGYWLSTGHVIIGNLESYGYQDLYDATGDNEFSVYIDNYWLDEGRVLEWINRGY